MSRDRDDAGRPRSSRPRDATGRPLPRTAGVAEPAPEPAALPPEAALTAAQDLLDRGLAFAAHEVLEAVWKSPAAGDERDLWRGLAQLAVGITHRQRGNATGAAALLRRSAAALAPWGDRHPHGIAVDALRRWAEAAAADPRVGPPPKLTVGQAADERA